MSSILSKEDVISICSRYEERYRMYGYNPKTLDWDKGKQNMRYSILLSQCDLTGKDIIDIGCGFGDLNRILSSVTGGNYRYLGIDVVPSLLLKAKELYGSNRIHFKCGDYLALNIQEADFAIASGIFNLKLKQGDNYGFIEQVMRKTFNLCRMGFAFDFLSDKVDYCKDNTFHSSPERILSIAYSLSRNVALLNNYMPFEFSLFVWKDDSFDHQNTIFKRWFNMHYDVDI